MSENLEGGPGRANNVAGTKDDQSNSIVAHDFGRGINTDVAMARLEGNRAVYQRDQGLETAYGQMEEPDQYEEKVNVPGFVKRT